MRRRGVALLALVGALTLVTWAAVWGWAELLVAGPRQAMARWEQSGVVDDGDDWARAWTRLERARRLNPYSADYTADLGRLHEWRAFQQRLSPQDAHAQRQLATSYYQSTLRLRPTWGMAWARLAYSNAAQTGSMNGKSFAALEKAVEFAPWESDVQRTVIWLGITRWDEMPKQLQDQVKGMVRRVLETKTLSGPGLDEFILDLAARHGWQDQLRPMLVTPAQVERLDALQRARAR